MVQTLSIRTKLIMAMLALVATVTLMGVTADAANAAGVTEIRWVENHTPFPVYVENHEPNPNTKMLVAPNTARSVNQRIPWVFDKTDFERGHYIELGYLYPYSYVDLERLAIWQENRGSIPYPGDKVRYTEAEGTFGSWRLNYDPEAGPIPGNSNTGGRRILIIKFTTWQVTPGGLVPNMDAHLCQPCP
jgi:hypothetical protein